MDLYALARHASSFMLPIAEAIEDRDMEEALLTELGFVLPPGLTIMGGFRTALEGIADAIVALEDHEPEQRDSTLELLSRATAAFRSVVSVVDTLSDHLTIEARDSAFVRDTDALAVLPRRLLDYLALDFFDANFPVLHEVLRTWGVVEEREIKQDNDPLRVTFVERTVHWDRLARLISEPLASLKERYGWGGPTGIDAATLFERLRDLATAAGLHSDVRALDERVRDGFNHALRGAGAVASSEDTVLLRIPLLPSFDIGLAADLYPIIDGAGRVDGIGLAIVVEGTVPDRIPLYDGIEAEVSLGTFTNGLGAILQPGRPPQLLSALTAALPAEVLDDVAVDAQVALICERRKARPWCWWGEAMQPVGKPNPCVLALASPGRPVASSTSVLR